MGIGHMAEVGAKVGAGGGVGVGVRG